MARSEPETGPPHRSRTTRGSWTRQGRFRATSSVTAPVLTELTPAQKGPEGVRLAMRRGACRQRGGPLRWTPSGAISKERPTEACARPGAACAEAPAAMARRRAFKRGRPHGQHRGAPTATGWQSTCACSGLQPGCRLLAEADTGGDKTAGGRCSPEAPACGGCRSAAMAGLGMGTETDTQGGPHQGKTILQDHFPRGLPSLPAVADAGAGANLCAGL